MTEKNENKVKAVLRNRLVVAGLVSVLAGIAATAGYNTSPELQDAVTQLLSLLVNLM